MRVDETVDDFGKPMYRITTPKMKSEVVVYKSNDGFAHFKIKWTKGATPKKLTGSYTGLREALKDVTQYISTMATTKTQRTETYYEENH